MYEVRVAGPDDVHKHDDELAALRQANAINATYLADRMAHPDDEVLCVAVVHEVPEAKASAACDKDPRGCWNIRCQLGKRCCRA